MSILVFDLENYYRQTFGGRPYKIGKQSDSAELKPFTINGINSDTSEELYSDAGHLLKTQYLNKEIWLPVKLFGLKSIGFSFDELLLPYTTVKVSAEKSIIRTPLTQRKGTVKELYSMDDYKITIKGFVIDENRKWPERDLKYLKGIVESDKSIGLDNALTNIYLEDGGQQVAVINLDLPEVSGGRKHVRPFVLTLESDNVFELIVDQ